MAVYFVSYKIDEKHNDYDELIEAIKEYDAGCRLFGNQWFLSSEGSAEEVQEDLAQYLYEGDFILVMEIDENYAGWLPERVVDWLDENL